MSGTNNTPARGDAIPRHVRPLPSAPSLEYERKEAKTLLKGIRTGHADALRRVHAAHPVSLRDRQYSALQLADAQHVIAREYGFASWPRLVDYFDEMERHRNAPRYNSSDGSLESFAARARSIVRQHDEGDVVGARASSRTSSRVSTLGRPPRSWRRPSLTMTCDSSSHARIGA
ncbi:hypothetical protein BH11GEM1_BH11GEM1_21990 [soil metagenome]